MTQNQSYVVTDNDNLQYIVLTDFEHLEEVNKLIDELDEIIGNQNREEKWEDRLKYIFDQYQDQPHLLDPYLEILLKKCIGLIGKPKIIERKESFVFRLIYLMVKTRGYKTIIRLMPHEVSDLEPVLSMLSDVGAETNENWQARYVLILWLSIVIIIPFDMNLFDTPDKKPITDRIIETGKRFLHSKDVSQNASAFMLAKFVCRPDAIENRLLETIVNWAIEQIKTVEMDSIIGHNFMCGLLRFFTYLFKFGKREDLLPFSLLVLQTNNAIDSVKWDREILLCRLRTKLVQRIGLIFLKMKVISWRYQRGNRILLNNIGQGTNINGEISSTDDALEEDDSNFEVSEHLDEVVDFLIYSLKNYFTTVRWSAAKGIGRICSRLPKSLADDVVEAILVLFSRLEGFSSWHGGCLALAELGRRGLLLPQRLPEVLPLIYKALFYDEKSGECSYGSNVRDAACYVCWSFARAYNPEEMTKYVVDIASALVMVTLFDREVNVRRAASAAFQENVGRQGQFPNGIDILTNCDYFAVGNLTNCFLNLSVYIASFKDYIIPMIDHLVQLKVGHWDYDIRDLTAKALNKLFPFAPDYMVDEVLPNLIKSCVGLDLYKRQGAIMCVGELVRAMPEPHLLSDSIKQEIKSINDVLEQRLQFRGLSGELMRRAVCRLIFCCAEANLEFYNDPIIDKWYKFLVECTAHKEKLVRIAATEAFPNFLKRYMLDCHGNTIKEFTENYINDFTTQIVDTTTEYIQISTMIILGKTPLHILESYSSVDPSQRVFIIVLNTLLDACSNDITKSCKWGEGRSYAVAALIDVCETIGIPLLMQESDLLQVFYKTLLYSLDDYTFDSHGDIGALLRESAMRQLLRLTRLVTQHLPIDHPLFATNIPQMIMAKVAQQSMEKIDRVRKTAGSVFYDIIYLEPPLPNIPHHEKIKNIFVQKDCDNLYWAAPQLTFPLFCQLLEFEEYRYCAILGLCISVGGMTEKTVQHSREALHNYIKERESDHEYLMKVSTDMLEIFSNFSRQDRVICPLLKTLDFLLTDPNYSSFICEDHDELLFDLIDAVKSEISYSKDVQKIKSGIEVFCTMLQFSEDIWMKALSSLMVLLGHKFPVIRKHTASYLYQSLLMYDIIEEEKLEQVMTILQDTVWDKNVKEVREIRNSMCELFGLPTPKMIVTN